MIMVILLCWLKDSSHENTMNVCKMISHMYFRILKMKGSCHLIESMSYVMNFIESSLKYSFTHVYTIYILFTSLCARATHVHPINKYFIFLNDTSIKYK